MSLNTAGTVATPGTASAMLKTVFLQKIISTLNEKQVALKKFSKDPFGFSGRELKYFVVTGREDGVGARAEEGNLPRARAGTSVQASIETANLVARAGFTKQMIEMSKTDVGSFARIAANKMKGLTEAMYDDNNRQIFGNEESGYTGKTGVLARIASSASSTSQTFTNVDHIRKGMSLAMGTSAQLTAGEGYQTAIVSAVNRTTKVVTFATSVNCSANDAVVRGDADGTSFNQELTGLEFLIKNSGTLHGIDPTDHPSWASLVEDANSQYFLTDDKIQLMLDNVSDECGDCPDLMLMNRLQRRLWVQTQLPNKTFNTQQIKGGWRGQLVYEGGDDSVPLVVDKHCSTTKVYFVNSQDVRLFQQSDYKFLDDDGSVFQRIANKTSFEVVLFAMKQLGLMRRNSHGKYTSLATTAAS